LLGIAGVTASACIYACAVAPGVEHALHAAAVQPDGALLGRCLPPPSASAICAGSPWPQRNGRRAVRAAGVRFLRCIASDSLELEGHRASALDRLGPHLVARGALLAVGAARCRWLFAVLAAEPGSLF
jgi:hypothetical protein